LRFHTRIADKAGSALAAGILHLEIPLELYPLVDRNGPVSWNINGSLPASTTTTNVCEMDWGPPEALTVTSNSPISGGVHEMTPSL
jgi:hypothetical protein